MSALPEIPAFLVAKPDEPRPELKDTHRLAILQLSAAEALRVHAACKAKNPKFPDPLNDGSASEAKGLLLAALKAGNGQADLVMSIVRDNSPIANSAAEKLVGKPIVRAPERGAHAPRDSRPPKPARNAKPKKYDETDVIIFVLPNPKRAGQAPAIRYDNYRLDMTIAEALKAGLTHGDIAWDLSHEFIKTRKST